VESGLIAIAKVESVTDSSTTLKINRKLVGNSSIQTFAISKKRRDQSDLLNDEYLYFLYESKGTNSLEKAGRNQPSRLKIEGDSVIVIKHGPGWYACFSEEYCYPTNKFMAKPLMFEKEQFFNAIVDVHKKGKKLLKLAAKEPFVTNELDSISLTGVINIARPKYPIIESDYLIKFMSKSKSHEYLIYELLNDLAQQERYYLPRRCSFLHNY
jgi:hypothetical protein